MLICRLPAFFSRLDRSAGAGSASRRLWSSAFEQPGEAILAFSIPRLSTEPVWPRSLTLFAIAGILLASAASVFDGAIIHWVRSADHPTLEALRFVTDLALVQWYLFPLGVLIVWTAVQVRRTGPMRKRAQTEQVLEQALFCFATIGGAQLLTRLLKWIFGRARPPLIGEGGPHNFVPFTWDDHYWSLPSGHSTTAGALAVILMIWFPRWRWLALFAGLLLAASRVAADAHYPSDVVAGFTVGSIFAIALSRLLATRRIAMVIHPGWLLPALRFDPLHPKRAHASSA